MSETSETTLSALITLPEGEGHTLLLGKSVAERQLDFALAAGADRVILVGNGASETATALRHQAERAGARLVVVSGAHALAAMARKGGRLLVLQREIAPISPDALDALSRDEAVLICPAGIGSEAGFERIDLARCWAGALVIAEDRATGLLDLPDDIEAAPALLRIALQAGVAERALGESELASGDWTCLSGQTDPALVEEKWLRRREQSPRTLSKALADGLAGRWLRRFGVRKGHVALLAALCLVSLLLALWAGWQTREAVSFALLALSVLILETGLALEQWRRFPFGKRLRLSAAMLAVDLSIAACGYFAIWGTWYERAFAPLVLILALHIPTLAKPVIERIWRDRALVALALAGAGLLGAVEQGIMAISLLVLACALPLLARSRS